MKNEKQIVLFIKSNTTFNQTQLAAKLNEKFPELGSPAIFPANDNDKNQPLMVFNQGVMGLTLNFNEASFIYFEDDKEKCEKLLADIMDFFDDYGLDFVRMGYISTFLKGKKDLESFKAKMFKEPDEIIKEDFQLSWYTKTTIDSVLVNIWEKYLTDFYNKIDLVSVFDINTPVSEEYNISSNFVSDFLKKCDKYIDDKLKKRL